MYLPCEEEEKGGKLSLWLEMDTFLTSSTTLRQCLLQRGRCHLKTKQSEKIFDVFVSKKYYWVILIFVVKIA